MFSGTWIKRAFEMQGRRMVWCAILLLFASVVVNAQDPAAGTTQAAGTPSIVNGDEAPNSARAERRHYVVLVSMDGFRWNYAQQYGAPHLLAIAARGASVPDGMLPSYPSQTFPNHYTLVTGLYPEHHGIVADAFYDPARQASFLYTNPQTSNDGSWYGGTPLWVLAEEQGMRAACMYWIGSEAEIDGKRPSYYAHYDGTVPDEARVDQVVAWLKLPPEQRPHLITLYFSEPDHSGHLYGPESPEVAASVRHLDEVVGDLEKKLNALNLPIDLIVLSDHGSVTLKGRWTELKDYIDISHLHYEISLLYPESEAETDKVYSELKQIVDSGKVNTFTVYRRADVPAHLHYDSNPRIGDPVVVATGPYAVRAAANTWSHELQIGDHGADPQIVPEMKTIFYAEGPDIKPGVQLPTFENVDVYPLIAKILKLKTPPIDGKLGPVKEALTGK